MECSLASADDDEAPQQIRVRANKNFILGLKTCSPTWEGFITGLRRDCLRRREFANKSQRQTQSGLGGNSHGAACRVDRLRLLGNGVVPAQAELAFRTLYGELMDL